MSDEQKEWMPNLAEYLTLARRCEKLESQLDEKNERIKDLEEYGNTARTVIAEKRKNLIKLEDDKLVLEKRIAAQDWELGDYVTTTQRLNEHVKELESDRACCTSQFNYADETKQALQARIGAAVWIRIAHEMAWGSCLFLIHKSQEFQKKYIKEFFPEILTPDEDGKAEE